MPFPMRIQPIDAIRNDTVKPPVLKFRLRRLFDRPFNGVLKTSTAEKTSVSGEKDGGGAGEFEPSSISLDKMVQNFLEGNGEKQSAAKCARNRCNCFNGNSNDSSDDELDFSSDSFSANSSFSDPSDALKSLIPCETMAERNLLADTSGIVEKHNRTCKGKHELRKIVTGGLIALGYDASICKSEWKKSSSIPAGEYVYTEVMLEGERLIVDVDFRSEFEIARSTKAYRAVLQCLPYIFVGKTNRLLQIVCIASEATRSSLKKKGMHVAPWRKPEYVKSKWLAPHTRAAVVAARPEVKPENRDVSDSEAGELDLIFGEGECSAEEAEKPSMTWQLPELRPKSSGGDDKAAAVIGLAALLKEKH